MAQTKSITKKAKSTNPVVNEVKKTAQVGRPYGNKKENNSSGSKTRKNVSEVTQVLNNIKSIRAIKGFSQEFIANKLDCDYSTYGKIENGKSSLTLDRLFELSKILEVPFSRLFRDMPNFENNEVFPEGKTSSNNLKITIELPGNSVDLSQPIVKDLLAVLGEHSK